MAIAAALGLGLCAAPAAAAVGHATARADQAALGDYHDYLSSLLSGLDNAATREAGVVASAGHNCPHALVGLNSVRAGKRVRAAARAYGNEIDDDLTLASLAPVKGPLGQLEDGLSGLVWSLTGADSTVNQLLSKQRALADMPQSDYCGDAYALAGHPARVPVATAGFLRRFNRARAALNSAQSAFGALLSDNAPAAAGALLSEDQSLAGQYSRSAAALQKKNASALLSELSS